MLLAAVASLTLATTGCDDGDSNERAPTDAGHPGLEIDDVYLGVSCPQGNLMGCDRVGLYVRTQGRGANPDFLIARFAGHELRLVNLRPVGSDYQGFLRSDGLLHRGPLAVDANRKDKWFGSPPVRVPMKLRAVYGGREKPDATRYLEEVTLGAGYG